MRWRRTGRSPDVIDARGGGGGRLGFPGGGRVAVPGGLGIAGVIVYVLLQVLSSGGGQAFGVDSQFGAAPQAPDARGIPAAQDPERDLKDFSAYVFTRANDTWEQIFSQQGQPYERAKLVLYRAGVNTGGCGSASSAVGPFYCPGDGRVYIDLSFYVDMQRQLGASGDFAWAYVIAHEVGHHVQQQLGTSDEVRRLQQENRNDANALSVRLELQADCYSGVWADTVFEAGDLEPGDVQEAVTASEAVGDDRLQSRAGGGVDTDSFTHGSSEQRARWFNAGRERGEPGDCDTFSVEEP
ncbi:MAG TPA: neutral zinc metallopeptidase [Thermoleophilaceae bacterium]|nr:neutral zinc metallopeptidase [Thermoleophilaceae bacterium]